MSGLPVDLVDELGTQGLSTRWLGRLDGRAVIVRLPSDGRLPQDAEARLLDAAELLRRHPVHGLPELVGTVGDVACPGLVLRTAAGRTLRELRDVSAPTPDAIEHLVHQLGTLLQDLRSIHGRDPVRLRGIGLDTVVVFADGHLVYEAVESAGGLWPKRATRTRQLPRADQDALPWTPDAQPADDVFDLGLLVVELLRGPADVKRLLDAEVEDVGAYRVVWQDVTRRLPLEGAFATLVRRCLEWYPEERPRPQELVWGTTGGGESRAAMQAWFAEVGPRAVDPARPATRTLEIELPPPLPPGEEPRRRPAGPTVLTPLQSRWASEEAAARSLGRTPAAEPPSPTEEVPLEPVSPPPAGLWWGGLAAAAGGLVVLGVGGTAVILAVVAGLALWPG